MKLGAFIGGGCHRKVHRHFYDKTLVVKVPWEYPEFNRKANQVEWRLWNKIKKTKWAQYFVPLVRFDGTHLLAKRVKPIRTSRGYETIRLPNGIKDLKLDNLGIYKNRLVIIDFNLIRYHNLKKWRLKPLYKLLEMN